MLTLSSRLLATGSKYSPGCVRNFSSKPARSQCKRHGSAREQSAAGAPGTSAMSASLSLSLSSSARFAAGAPFGLAGESSSSEHSARRRPATGAGAPPLSLSLPPPASSWTCDRTTVVSHAGCRPLRACYAGHTQGCRASTLPLPAPSQPTPATTQVLGRAVGL